MSGATDTVLWRRTRENSRKVATMRNNVMEFAQMIRETMTEDMRALIRKAVAEGTLEAVAQELVNKWAMKLAEFRPDVAAENPEAIGEAAKRMVMTAIAAGACRGEVKYQELVKSVWGME